MPENESRIWAITNSFHPCTYCPRIEEYILVRDLQYVVHVKYNNDVDVLNKKEYFLFYTKKEAIAKRKEILLDHLDKLATHVKKVVDEINHPCPQVIVITGD